MAYIFIGSARDETAVAGNIRSYPEVANFHNPNRPHPQHKPYRLHHEVQLILCNEGASDGNQHKTYKLDENKYIRFQLI